MGAKHAIAVNSCTAAMHLALEAIGLRAGDEVITTPMTFAATAEVVRYFDAKPVLADIEPRNLNIDPDCIEAAVTPRTRAIIPVHLGGQNILHTGINCAFCKGEAFAHNRLIFAAGRNANASPQRQDDRVKKTQSVAARGIT